MEVSLLIRRKTSKPSEPGKIKSSKIMSGFWNKLNKPIFAGIAPLLPDDASRDYAKQLLLDKQIANFKDVPYQSLMKIFLAEKVKEELRSS